VVAKLSLNRGAGEEAASDRHRSAQLLEIPYPRRQGKFWQKLRLCWRQTPWRTDTLSEIATNLPLRSIPLTRLFTSIIPSGDSVVFA
jgi:hypothetical protein